MLCTSFAYGVAADHAAAGGADDAAVAPAGHASPASPDVQCFMGRSSPGKLSSNISIFKNKTFFLSIKGHSSPFKFKMISGAQQP